MRRVRGTRRKVDEERFFWRSCLLLTDPPNRFFRKRLGEVPRRVVVWHLKRGRVFEERRVPLIRLAALEPVEVVEPLPGGPAIVGAANAELVVGGVVPFAEGRGRVMIAFEDLRDARGFLWPLSVVAGKTGRHLGDASGVDRGLVASRDQSRQ